MTNVYCQKILFFEHIVRYFTNNNPTIKRNYYEKTSNVFSHSDHTDIMWKQDEKY